MSAFRKHAPNSAPPPMAARRSERAGCSTSSVPVSPNLADHEPPPIRLSRNETIATLSPSLGLAQPINLSSLAISSPHDAAEREAGATARKIVRMDTSAASVAYVSTGTGVVFRLLKSPAQAEPFEIKPYSQTIARSALTVPLVTRLEAAIHRKAERRSETASSHLGANIQASMSGGEPLPIGIRSFMEQRFGADFGNVRIHNSGKAAALNNQLSARAFTTRNHVFFGQDTFKPEEKV